MAPTPIITKPKYKIGELLKVSNHRECFWVEVTAIHQGTFQPVYHVHVDNTLVDTPAYTYNDHIYVEQDELMRVPIPNAPKK